MGFMPVSVCQCERVCVAEQCKGGLPVRNAVRWNSVIWLHAGWLRVQSSCEDAVRGGLGSFDHSPPSSVYCK